MLHCVIQRDLEDPELYANQPDAGSDHHQGQEFIEFALAPILGGHLDIDASPETFEQKSKSRSSRRVKLR